MALLAGAALTAAAGLSPATAAAATPLTWSLASTFVRECLTPSCSVTQDADVDTQFGYDLDANAASSVDGLGSAHGSAEAGSGSLALPVLKAFNQAEINATSGAFVQAKQGYRWTGTTGIDIAFSGLIDYVATNGPSGEGFVNAGLAIADASAGDAAVGALWAGSQPDGTFTATCATPGAVSVANSGRQYGLGSQAFGLDTSDGGCGSGVFHVQPGQEFYVYARLNTFGLMDAERDASHTFTIGLSQSLSAETQASIQQYLRPMSAVPEPSSWALMIVGFGALGAALRGRPRTAAAAA